MRKMLCKEIMKVKDAKMELKKTVFGTRKSIGLLDSTKEWKGKPSGAREGGGGGGGGGGYSQ